MSAVVQPTNMENILKYKQKLYDSLSNNSMSAENIITTTVTLMQISEQFKTLTGPMKKQLVLDVIKDSIKDNEELVYLVDMILPSLIDTIISVDKKELRIKVKKCFFKLCKK